MNDYNLFLENKVNELYNSQQKLKQPFNSKYDKNVIIECFIYINTKIGNNILKQFFINNSDDEFLLKAIIDILNYNIDTEHYSNDVNISGIYILNLFDNNLLEKYKTDILTIKNIIGIDI